MLCKTAVGKTKDPNYQEVRGFVPTPLAQRFKGLCKQLGIEHGDVLTPFVEQWVKETEERLAKESRLQQNDSPTIPNLLRAYILVTYRGVGERQLQQMASDCGVSLEQVQAVLEEQPVSEFSAGVFAAKLKMSIEEFTARYPVVRDRPPAPGQQERQSGKHRERNQSDDSSV
jgi:hypothetical protein